MAPSRPLTIVAAADGAGLTPWSEKAQQRAAEQAAGFLGAPTQITQDGPEISGTIESARSPERNGDFIGRYKLLEVIGEGGFGVVWMAEQREPVKRRVALKVIKLGMDTRQVIARFEAERQALALMDHPNIARVFDAGSTEAGRPYFVMEYIKGVPILEYCDGQRLDTRARLGLFIDVCHAIQHAHQKGIIHRDVKPRNIMILPGPRHGEDIVKVIDFGLARERLTAVADLRALGWLGQGSEWSGVPLAPQPNGPTAGPAFAWTLRDKTPVYAEADRKSAQVGVLPLRARVALLEREAAAAGGGPEPSSHFVPADASASVLAQRVEQLPAVGDQILVPHPMMARGAFQARAKRRVADLRSQVPVDLRKQVGVGAAHIERKDRLGQMLGHAPVEPLFAPSHRDRKSVV